jgi:hypothetical protein
MIVLWAVKDLISNKFIKGNHYWSFGLSENIDEAYLWNKVGPAKSFITSRGIYNSNNNEDPYDLVPVSIEVSRRLG